MAWKKVSGQQVDEFWKAQKPGDELMGAFLDTFVSNSGRFGPQTNAVIEHKGGKRFGVGITAGLRALENLKPGQGVRIVYLGMERSKNGNDFHKYDIFLWDEEQKEDDPISDFSAGSGQPFQATDEDVPF